MFIAGYLPGILIALSLMITVFIISHKKISPSERKSNDTGDIQAIKRIYLGFNPAIYYYFRNENRNFHSDGSRAIAVVVTTLIGFLFTKSYIGVIFLKF